MMLRAYGFYVQVQALTYSRMPISQPGLHTSIYFDQNNKIAKWNFKIANALLKIKCFTALLGIVHTVSAMVLQTCYKSYSPKMSDKNKLVFIYVPTKL